MSILAKNALNDDGKIFPHRNEYYKIEKYLNNFLNGKYSQRFIVMPGLRGVGKTTILYQIYQYLRDNNVSNEDILYLDVKMLIELSETNIYEAVNLFLENIHGTNLVNLNKKIFLLFDEAHFDSEWSSYGKFIFDQTKNIFMIFTGSSALDFEMNIDCVRRSIKVPIFSLNFSEYLLLKYDINFPKFSLKNLVLNRNIQEFDNSVIHDVISSNNLDFNFELENFLIIMDFLFL